MSVPRIVLGISGGIGAYKAAEILRTLQKAGADVTVAMTRHAAEFITPLTMQTLSGRPVVMDLFDLGRGADIEHIELVRKTDVLVVAPATANVIGKFAWGIADDFLSTFFTAVKCPVLIAPAMNTRMWTSAATQNNVGRLATRGVTFVSPESGPLACGEEGEGRLAAPESIARQALGLACRGRSLAGLRALVTAGPTREPIDAVRVLTNRSSGRMGYAIASVLEQRGAEVTLISGPTCLQSPYGVERVEVETAEEMAAEVSRRLPRSGALWMVAAVADFRPERMLAGKASRRGQGLDVRWVPTEDILARAGQSKKEGQILVGFAAETGDLLRRARAKLQEKNLDAIVANDVSKPGVGFDVETNAVTVLRRKGRPVHLARASKREIAERLIDLVHGERSPAVSRRPRIGRAAVPSGGRGVRAPGLRGRRGAR